MKEIKSILFAAALSASFIADEAIAQPTLVDPIEVFEGSLDDPENAEIAIHWDVTNLTEDTLTLKVTRNIEQLVSPYNLPYDEDNEGGIRPLLLGSIVLPLWDV